MKNEIQILVNTLFWEKYIDVISEANYKEFVNEFYKCLEVMISSVDFIVHPEKALDLHSTVFVVKKISIII